MDKQKNNLKQDRGPITSKTIKQESSVLLNRSRLKVKEKENKTPPFPVRIFPDSIQGIIKNTHDTLNFPIDFISSSILFVSSVAIGNTYKVKVKNGWIENTTLYMSLIGPAGTNKSHPLSWALNPINRRQKEYNAQYKELQVLANDKESELEKPTLKKILVSDTTTETLALLLNNNQRGLGVCVDELNGWLSSFNRYNKGNDEEFWLSNWSGKSLIIDRKSSDLNIYG
jgi:hypothetical protein